MPTSCRRESAGEPLRVLDYSAPERFLRGRHCDHRIDVYGLGCLLYELLVGSRPFPVEGLARVRQAHVNTPPPEASQRVDVPASLDAVIAKAMAKDADQRYSSAGEFAAAEVHPQVKALEHGRHTGVQGDRGQVGGDGEREQRRADGEPEPPAAVGPAAGLGTGGRLCPHHLPSLINTASSRQPHPLGFLAEQHSGPRTINRDMSEDLARLRASLADSVIGNAGPLVADALRTVPRHLFLPGVPPEAAYSDEAVVTKRGADGLPLSSSSQPALMASMLDQLALAPGQRVLEIGAGTGGAFTIPNVGPGSWTLEVVQQTGYVATNSPVTITPTSGTNITGQDLGEFQTIAISGEVFVVGGSRVQRVRGWEKDPDWKLQTEGRWTVAGLEKAAEAAGIPAGGQRWTANPGKA